jgi:hypothetical protein
MNSKFCWVENPYDYKVIFLDIDGVINIKGEGEFNTLCMDNLLTLIDDETRIVISSSWRTNDRIDLYEKFIYMGLYYSIWEKIIGITNKYIGSDFKRSRELEVKEWIDTYKPVDYVILDDTREFTDLKNFVKIKGNLGLTIGDCKTISDILN